MNGDEFKRPATERVKIHKARGGRKIQEKPDELAIEEPLEIRVKGQAVAITMRTPGHDHELACGFLLSEGLIRDRSDVTQVAYCLHASDEESKNILNVFVSPGVKIDFKKLTRHVFASSSCGMCGKATIDSIQQQFPGIKSRSSISKTVLEQLPDKLRKSQIAFDRTGGLHAAAIFDLEGNLIVSREDVGRHNAVDKVIGYGLLEGLLPFHSHILLVSGRASFEIMQKSLAAGIPTVAAVSAPSSLAVDFARESGQMLVGFLRGQNFNVYANIERLDKTQKPGRIKRKTS